MVAMRTSDDSPGSLRGRIFAYIVKYKLSHDGCAPSFRELMDALFIRSTSSVRYHLLRLEKIGMLCRPDGRRTPRTIQVVGGYQNAEKNFPDYFMHTGVDFAAGKDRTVERVVYKE